MELMVVLVVLSIIMSIGVPRLLGGDHREFQLAGDQVADLLTMYAQRTRTGTQPVALAQDYNRATGQVELMLMTLQEDEDERGFSDWVIDRYAKPVRLPTVIEPEGVTVVVDGEVVDISQWPVTTTRGQERPRIEITLRHRDEPAAITLTLASYAIGPDRKDSYGASTGPEREAVDLDLAGRSRDTW
jgi:type II secretory pathway pseudopilin PulG